MGLKTLVMIVFGTLNGLWPRRGKSKYLLGFRRESTLIYAFSLMWHCTSARTARRWTVCDARWSEGLIRVECLYAHALLHWFHDRANKSD